MEYVIEHEIFNIAILNKMLSYIETYNSGTKLSKNVQSIERTELNEDDQMN